MSTEDDLGRPIQDVVAWFNQETQTPYYLFRVTPEAAADFPNLLSDFVRRNYISDENLTHHAQTKDATQVLGSKMPDRGATMAGDFGEILAYLYTDLRNLPQTTIGPRKFRLKQDKTKPAPYFDVVQFVVPNWPAPSDEDVLVVSEAKLKSTKRKPSKGYTPPIPAAIGDIKRTNFTGHLAKTLRWLKDRSITESLGDVTTDHLERFINAIEHPPHTTKKRAVAIICSSLIDDEIDSAPETIDPDCETTILVVPDLKNLYETVFDAAGNSAKQFNAPRPESSS